MSRSSGMSSVGGYSAGFVVHYRLQPLPIVHLIDSHVVDPANTVRLFCFAVFVRDVIPGDRVKCLITEIKKSFAQPSQPQRLISNASLLVSELTHFAGIVLTPRRKSLKIRHIEFVSLSEKRILLILGVFLAPVIKSCLVA